MSTRQLQPNVATYIADVYLVTVEKFLNDIK